MNMKKVLCIGVYIMSILVLLPIGVRANSTNSTSTITVGSDKIFVGDSTTVTATRKNDSGSSISGKNIIFTVGSGASISVADGANISNSSGVVTGTFTCSSVGTYTIGGVDITLSDDNVAFSATKTIMCLSPTFNVSQVNTVTSSDKKASVSFPANVSDGNGILASISEVVSGSPVIPTGYQLISKIYDIIATDANGNKVTLKKSVDVILSYSGNYSSKEVYYYDEDAKTWKVVSNATVDATNKTIKVSVSHFTKFAVLARTSSISSTGGFLSNPIIIALGILLILASTGYIFYLIKFNKKFYFDGIYRK